MKLRLTDTTVRLRLAQSDVTRFCRGGRIEMTTRFGPGDALTVALETDAAAVHPTARFDGRRLVFAVPAEQARAWTASDEIGFEAEQAVGAEPPLTILVEKDLQCLHRDAEKRRADAFPHPADET